MQVRARRAEAMAPLGVLAHSRICPGQWKLSGEMRFAVWTGRMCTGRAKLVQSGTSARMSAWLLQCSMVMVLRKRLLVLLAVPVALKGHP